MIVSLKIQSFSAFLTLSFRKSGVGLFQAENSSRRKNPYQSRGIYTDMNYATIKKCDIANGEGVRVSLFVSGCTHHCKNCFNEVAWDFSYGEPFTAATEEEIFAELEHSYVNGLSLLGGEPFEPQNQRALLPFVKRVREKFPKKNIWCYTGFVFDEKTGLLKELAKNTECTAELIRNLDVLVDGPFVDELKDISLVFRGSSNQRVIDVQKTLQSGEIVLYLE